MSRRHVERHLARQRVAVPPQDRAENPPSRPAVSLDPPTHNTDTPDHSSEAHSATQRDA